MRAAIMRGRIHIGDLCPACVLQPVKAFRMALLREMNEAANEIPRFLGKVDKNPDSTDIGHAQAYAECVESFGSMISSGIDLDERNLGRYEAEHGIRVRKLVQEDVRKQHEEKAGAA